MSANEQRRVCWIQVANGNVNNRVFTDVMSDNIFHYLKHTDDNSICERSVVDGR